MMEILGFTAATMTLLICISGVGFRIFQGMQGKPLKEFNINLALTTLVIGVVVSIGLVAPIIETIPDTDDSLMQLQVVAGQFAVVIGVDAAARKGYKKITKSNIKVTTIEEEKEPEPIDDSDDLPPGKGEEPIRGAAKE